MATEQLQAVRQLHEHAARLFLPDTDARKTNIDVITITGQKHVKETISDEKQFQHFLLQDNSTPSGAQSNRVCTIYMLKQKSTWSHLLLTWEYFNCLLTKHNVFPAYGNYISSFGRRSRDDDSRFGGYERYYNSKRGTLEICYNLRYPARHGREGDYTPWSFRQVGIYHSFHFETGHSTWILVQCPLSVQLLVEAAQQSYSSSTSDSTQPMMLHYLILNEITSQWRDYGNFLEVNLQTINDKSQGFGSSQIIRHNYDVTFDDAQDVQLLQIDILNGQHAIESASKIIAGVQTHQRHLMALEHRSSPQVPMIMGGNATFDMISVGLESVLSRLDAENRGLLALLAVSNVVKDQLHKILEYRNDQSVQANTLALATISQESKIESIQIQRIAEETFKDSRSMKILSAVALIYLPASLIISMFSSDFIIDKNLSSDPTKSHFAISSQFWWFPALTAPLLALTVGLAVAWSRWQLRMRPPKYNAEFNPATSP